MKRKNPAVIIYTDGASRGNPGLGGWAAIIITQTDAVELADKRANATNNQMELEAVIQGLTYVQVHLPDATVTVHADSRYVLNGIEKWVDGWMKNGWQTLAKKPVENKAQWQKILALRNHFGQNLSLVKVAGHSGHLYNDRCDELAVMVAVGKNPELFSGTVKAYEMFLKDNPPRSEKKSGKGSRSKSTAPAYSYVSVVGGKVYADKTWPECEKRVKGGKGAKYKKVFSKAEETELIQDYTLLTLL